jgi:hypothetical protein
MSPLGLTLYQKLSAFCAKKQSGVKGRHPMINPRWWREFIEASHGTTG